MPNTVDARPRFMKVRKAAEYLGIGRTSLKDLIAAGAFPGASKIGSHHLIPIEDLDGYADRLIAAARANRERAAVSRRSPRETQEGRCRLRRGGAGWPWLHGGYT
jgi:excisionase family DNA binding protein